MRRTLTWILLTVAPLGAQAATANRTPAAFRAGVEAVQKLMGASKWPEASAKLAELLVAHAGTNYARLAKSEIVDLDKHCRFHAGFRPPKLGELISGEVIAFHPGRRYLALRYHAKNLEDFHDPNQSGPGKKLPRGPFGKKLREELERLQERWERIRRLRGAMRRGAMQPTRRPLLHPAVFTKYTLKLEGEQYQGADVLVCTNPDGACRINFGVAPSRFLRTYIPTQIARIQGDRTTELHVNHWGADQKPRRSKKKEKRGGRKNTGPSHRFPMKHGQPFTAVIEVRPRSVRAKYDGRTIARGSWRSHSVGGFAVQPHQFDQLEIAGTVDLAWIRNKQDAARQHKLVEFGKSYDPRQVLPKWLFEPVRVTKTNRPPQRPYPGHEKPADMARLERTYKELSKRNYRWALLALAAGKRKKALPEIVHAYLEAWALWGLGRLDRARPLCERVTAGDPEFANGHSLMGLILTSLRQHEAAATSFRAMLELLPENPVPYGSLARTLLTLRRVDEARTLVDRAHMHGVDSAELRAIDKRLTRIQRGPVWPQRFEVQTAHYMIASDIDEDVCKDAGAVLERAYRYYRRHLGGKKDRDSTERRFQVYLFAGKAGFDEYCRGLDLRVPVHTNGLYSTELEQLLIWNLPSRREMLRTIRHEGLHQFLDMIASGLPAWLHEGLAEYYEASRTSKGQPQPGAVQPRHLRALALVRKRGRISVRELMGLEHRHFYRNAQRNYPMSWALVHFLRRGKPRYRDAFESLLASLRAGTAYREAHKAAFADLDLERVDVEVWKYVAKLRDKVGK